MDIARSEQKWQTAVKVGEEEEEKKEGSERERGERDPMNV